MHGRKLGARVEFSSRRADAPRLIGRAKMNQDPQADERNPLDFVHYAICFAGFIAGVSGIVVSSITFSVAGLALMLIGFAYFAASAACED